MREVEIGGRKIGPGHPPFVVAEMSANHGGRLERAMAILEAAKNAGAHALKLQTYRPEDMTLDAGSDPAFLVGGGTLWDGRKLYDLYAEAQTPWEWHAPLFKRGAEIGLPVFSSPFSDDAVDLLEELGAPAYKIASFEIVHLPLIRRAAQTGKPLVISTGLASLAEITDAVATARDAGAEEIILLKCTSAYPAPPSEMNLRTISDLGATFDVPVGLSDHTVGNAVAIASVAIGACMIEKHITLSRADGGPDAAFSAEPAELADLCRGLAHAHAALGTVTYEIGTEQLRSQRFRRSLVLARDIRKGELFTEEHLAILRPAIGLPPRYRASFLGRPAARDLKRGAPIDWSVVE